MSRLSLIGISGSTRSGSFNSALLRAAAYSLPEGQLTFHMAMTLASASPDG